jgi:hypothetical protein
MNTNFEVCNIEYDNELNERMNRRYFPSRNLRPNFDPRPLSTKYEKFNKSSMSKMLPPLPKVSGEKQSSFSPNKVFYPGNSKAPVHYALQSIDIESHLRNQYHLLQKNEKLGYTPHHKSNMYSLKDQGGILKANNIKMNNAEVNFSFNPDRCNLAPEAFNNSTRYNLKNMGSNVSKTLV